MPSLHRRKGDGSRLSARVDGREACTSHGGTDCVAGTYRIIRRYAARTANGASLGHGHSPRPAHNPDCTDVQDVDHFRMEEPRGIAGCVVLTEARRILALATCYASNDLISDRQVAAVGHHHGPWREQTSRSDGTLSIGREPPPEARAQSHARGAPASLRRSRRSMHPCSRSLRRRDAAPDNRKDSAPRAYNVHPRP